MRFFFLFHLTAATKTERIILQHCTHSMVTGQRAADCFFFFFFFDSSDTKSNPVSQQLSLAGSVTIVHFPLLLIIKSHSILILICNPDIREDMFSLQLCIFPM